MSAELTIVLAFIVAVGVVLGWMIVASFHKLPMEVRAIWNSPEQQIEKSRRAIRSRTKGSRGKVVQPMQRDRRIAPGNGDAAFDRRTSTGETRRAPGRAARGHYRAESRLMLAKPRTGW